MISETRDFLCNFRFIYHAHLVGNCLTHIKICAKLLKHAVIVTLPQFQMVPAIRSFHIPSQSDQFNRKIIIEYRNKCDNNVTFIHINRIKCTQILAYLECTEEKLGHSLVWTIQFVAITLTQPEAICDSVQNILSGLTQTCLILSSNGII